MAKLTAKLRAAELASAQRDAASSEPAAAKRLRHQVAEQTARAERSQEARVTLERKLESRDKAQAALVAEKSSLAQELAQQKQALTAAAVHLRKLESSSSAASEVANLQRKHPNPNPDPNPNPSPSPSPSPTPNPTPTRNP